MSHPTTGPDGTAGSDCELHSHAPSAGLTITTHTAVVTLSALFIGETIGFLTYAVTPSIPTAAIAGITAFGTGFCALRQFIVR